MAAVSSLRDIPRSLLVLQMIPFMHMLRCKSPPLSVPLIIYADRLQICYDEVEELQEVETEDVLALQGAPELQPDEQEDDDASELDSASDMSDESEGK